MKIQDIMTPNPEYIQPETTVVEAAKKMKEMDVGLLPVGDGKRLKGMLTDRDLVIRVTAENLDASSTPVSDVMTPDIIYAYQDQEVKEAVEIMEKERIRRLIILDHDKNMTGIVALADLATRTPDKGPATHALEAVSA